MTQTNPIDDTVWRAMQQHLGYSDEELEVFKGESRNQNVMARLMWVIQERIYEGLDPRPFLYRAHCEDVGIGCGGWGQVTIEAKIMDRK